MLDRLERGRSDAAPLGVPITLRELLEAVFFQAHAVGSIIRRADLQTAALGLARPGWRRAGRARGRRASQRGGRGRVWQAAAAAPAEVNGICGRVLRDRLPCSLIGRPDRDAVVAPLLQEFFAAQAICRATRCRPGRRAVALVAVVGEHTAPRQRDRAGFIELLARQRRRVVTTWWGEHEALTLAKQASCSPGSSHLLGLRVVGSHSPTSLTAIGLLLRAVEHLRDNG